MQATYKNKNIDGNLGNVTNTSGEQQQQSNHCLTRTHKIALLTLGCATITAGLAYVASPIILAPAALITLVLVVSSVTSWIEKNGENNNFSSVVPQSSPKSPKANGNDLIILDFDQVTLMRGDKLSELRISMYTGFSSLPCYQDSKFKVEYTEQGYLVTRLRLENNPSAEPLEDIFKRVMPENCHFKVADIRALGNKNLGLRHISSHEKAQNEKDQGMHQGCSLNISFHVFEIMSPGAKYEGLHNKTDEEIEKLLPEYQQAIDQFIYRSIMDFDLKTDATKEDDMGRLGQFLNSTKITAFTIIDYGFNRSPCDVTSWADGMGRFRKTNISGENITILRALDVDSWTISDASKKQYVQNHLFDETLKLLVAHYRKSLLDYIREGQG